MEHWSHRSIRAQLLMMALCTLLPWGLIVESWRAGRLRRQEVLPGTESSESTTSEKNFGFDSFHKPFLACGIFLPRGIETPGARLSSTVCHEHYWRKR